MAVRLKGSTIQPHGPFVSISCGRAHNMDSQEKSRSPATENGQFGTYREIASTGQVLTQVPQSTQVPSLTVDLPSTIEIALTGQAPSQAPQPTHTSLLTLAAI